MLSVTQIIVGRVATSRGLERGLGVFSVLFKCSASKKRQSVPG